jgi:hypothetical protein
LQGSLGKQNITPTLSSNIQKLLEENTKNTERMERGEAGGSEKIL